MSTAFLSPAAAASAVKHALHEAAIAALAGQPDVDVSFGIRWPPVGHAALAVGSVETTPVRDELAGQGPRRTRYDDVEIGVNVFAEEAGFDESAEIAASDRAFAILDTLAAYLRVGDNTTLDSTALWCFLTTARSDGATDEDDQGHGWRVIEIAATFTARVLIRQP